MSEWLPAWTNAPCVASRLVDESASSAVERVDLANGAQKVTTGEVVSLQRVGTLGGSVVFVAEGFEWIGPALGVEADGRPSCDRLEVISPKPPRHRWRVVVAGWPLVWRERWSEAVVVLLDAGVGYPECESQAFDTVNRQRRDSESENESEPAARMKADSKQSVLMFAGKE